MKESAFLKINPFEDFFNTLFKMMMCYWTPLIGSFKLFSHLMLIQSLKVNNFALNLIQWYPHLHSPPSSHPVRLPSGDRAAWWHILPPTVLRADCHSYSRIPGSGWPRKVKGVQNTSLKFSAKKRALCINYIHLPDPFRLIHHLCVLWQFYASKSKHDVATLKL